LASRVVLAGERIVVAGGAVGFEDEVEVRPAEVGDVVAEWLVDVWSGEAVRLDEVEDGVLEVTAGGLVSAFDDRLRFYRRDPLVDEGFADRSAQRFKALRRGRPACARGW
jgi:hypothetical protein